MNDIYESCRKEAREKEQEEIKKWLGECKTIITKGCDDFHCCFVETVLFVENGVQVICLSCGVRTSTKTDRIYQKGVSQERTATSSVDKVIEEWNRRVDTNVCFSNILDR